MNPNFENDPRSELRFEWIKKYREIPPLKLEPQVSQLKKSEIKKINSGLGVYTGNWGEKQARHLLSRTLIGITKPELAYFKSLSLNEAVSQIVSESVLPEPPVNDYQGINSEAIDPHVNYGESWLNAPHGGQFEGLRVVSLKSWLIKNMINQEPNIHQKMVLFWSNLLVTKVWDVYLAKASYQYYKMLTENALGNYKTFIKKLTLDPSMLVFLNGAKNTKDAPDENYGRELQELFCIGKGSGSGYTEHDVQEAARVLTGWRITWEPYENPGQFTSYFDYNEHDRGNKRFSEFYNNKLIEGKYQENGANELDELINMIFENDETAKYICRRIYSFFVSNEITENVEQNIIEPLAQIFRTNNYEIKPVLETLFKSDHFFDPQNLGVLIKSPAEHTLGIWRTFNLNQGEPTDLLSDFEKHRSMLWQMSAMGMEIGDPPNVAGWTPYYQAPQFDKAWITTTTITKRAVTTDSLIFWGYWISNERKIKIDLIEFVKTLDNPEDPALLINEAVFLLLGFEITEQTKNELLSVLLSGQQTNYYWTIAWNDYLNNPNSATKRSVVETRLKSTFQRILQLAEFQLM